jgi:ABC-type transport system involved in multi-copper enzyme maturation permease subunit
VHAIGPTVDWLPLLPLSPFRWYQEPDVLTGGLQVANVAVLAGIAVVVYVAATVVFLRRDLSS